MTQNREIWKPIVGYNDAYEVSNVGNVRSLDRFIIRKDGVKTNLKGKILNHNICRKGYRRAKISENGHGKYCTIHRLVALSFIPNPKNLPQINHIDGNKFNNSVENLEWCTNAYNMKHAIKKGLMRFDNCKVKVSQYSMDGEYINTFDSITKAAENTGSVHSGISMCSRGLYEHSGGFKWVIEDD